MYNIIRYIRIIYISILVAAERMFEVFECSGTHCSRTHCVRGTRVRERVFDVCSVRQYRTCAKCVRGVRRSGVFECILCSKCEFEVFGSTVSHLSLCSHWFENACSRNTNKLKIKRDCVRQPTKLLELCMI